MVSSSGQVIPHSCGVEVVGGADTLCGQVTHSFCGVELVIGTITSGRQVVPCFFCGVAGFTGTSPVDRETESPK